MAVFTFVWRLENFSYFWQKEIPVKIISPKFHLTTIMKTTWRLAITDEKPADLSKPQIPTNMKFIKLYLERLADDGRLCLHLHIEAELLKVDGSLLRPRKLGIANTHSKFSNICVLHENVNFDSSIAEILPQDVLIVQLKIWSTSTSFLEKGHCLAQTRVEMESVYFIAIVEGIRNFKPGEQREVRIKSVSAEKPAFTVNICLSDEAELIINMRSVTFTELGFCKVFILDNSEKWEECGQNSEWEKNRIAFEFPLTLSFLTLMKNKKQYLQNNMVTLKFEVTFYGRPSTQQKNYEIEYKLISEKKNGPQKSPTTLEEDLISLYKEGTLCDLKLCAESETFSVHKTVLSARSPVFKKMLISDTAERVGDSVDVSDINPGTLRRLLLFIYTDTIAPMEWQSAMELYFAAVKYEIDSLKLKCSSFLKLNVQPSNCCDLLLLSDMHQDSDLKQFVQRYIVRRGKDVLETDEWRSFKGSHAQLALDAIPLKYARR